MYLLAARVFQHSVHILMLQGIVMWTDVRASRVQPCLSLADLEPITPLLRAHFPHLQSPTAGLSSSNAPSATEKRATTAFDPAARIQMISLASPLSRSSLLMDWRAVSSTAAHAQASGPDRLVFEGEKHVSDGQPPDLSEIAGNLSVPLSLWTQASRVPVVCPHPTSVFQVISLPQLGPKIPAVSFDSRQV